MTVHATRMLSFLAEKAGLQRPSQDVPISALTSDSRAVKPGTLFAALPGTRVDGVSYIPDAVRLGAAAVLTWRAPPEPVAPAVPLLIDADARRAFALMAAAFGGQQPETITAVTGTAGKTSVAGFLRQIWETTGKNAASIGTLGVVSKDLTRYGSLTTPDSTQLHELLAELAENGVTHAAMEASSHGLDQRRLDGVSLKAAAFTNLGRDHLDYHEDEATYFEAKLGLFKRVLGPDGAVVVDADEAWSNEVSEAARARGQRLFSIGEAGSEIRVHAVTPDGAAQHLRLDIGGTAHTIRLPLLGRFQVSNALVAAGLAIVTGTPARDAINALETIKGAPGRLDHVGDAPCGAHAFVDYAHKPDALATVLATLRPFARNRLVVVFGAGGDRDPGKRALMGDVAERLADLAIVTDDNPRTEDPATIRRSILAAAPTAREIGDRAEAIQTAVALLEAGDILVVAGKGHEEGQIVGSDVLPFSDHAVLSEALKA